LRHVKGVTRYRQIVGGEQPADQGTSGSCEPYLTATHFPTRTTKDSGVRRLRSLISRFRVVEKVRPNRLNMLEADNRSAARVCVLCVSFSARTRWIVRLGDFP
jgi:hypothetical protein